MLPLKSNFCVRHLESQEEIKCRVRNRSAAFHAWINSDLLGWRRQSWSSDPKDHLLWAIGLLTLIQLRLNDWLKDFKYNSITLCNISIFRLEPSTTQIDLGALMWGCRSHFEESGAGSGLKREVSGNPICSLTGSCGVCLGAVCLEPST